MGIKEKFKEGFRFTEEELKQISDNKFHNDTFYDRESQGYGYISSPVRISHNVRSILKRLFDGLRNIKESK